MTLICYWSFYLIYIMAKYHKIFQDSIGIPLYFSSSFQIQMGNHWLSTGCGVNKLIKPHGWKSQIFCMTRLGLDYVPWWNFILMCHINYWPQQMYNLEMPYDTQTQLTKANAQVVLDHHPYCMEFSLIVGQHSKSFPIVNCFHWLLRVGAGDYHGT